MFGEKINKVYLVMEKGLNLQIKFVTMVFG